MFVDTGYSLVIFQDMNEQVDGRRWEQTGPVAYLRHDEIVYIQCKEDSPIYVMHEELDIWALRKLPLPVPECFSFIPAGCLGFCRPDHACFLTTSEISG